MNEVKIGDMVAVPAQPGASCRVGIVSGISPTDCSVEIPVESGKWFGQMFCAPCVVWSGLISDCVVIKKEPFFRSANQAVARCRFADSQL